jgi:SAM-dependent methyltransferase
MGSYVLFLLAAQALVVRASTIQQHAEIRRDGSLGYARGSAVQDIQMKPLLRSFISSHPKAEQSLADSANDRFPSAFHALHDLDLAYKGHVSEPFFVKIDIGKAMKTVKEHGEPINGATYGEVHPTSFVQMLDSVNATPGMRYYDLGSGMGKTVIMAALLGFNATGVELVDQRWKESCLALGRAKRRGLVRNLTTGVDARFEKASMMDVDLSDADIIFANSVLFNQDMLDRVAKHAEFMKPGTKIITTAGLKGPYFKDVANFVAPTSWSEKSRWKIQEVTRQNSSASLAVADQDKGKPLGTDPASRCSLSDPEDAPSMLEGRGTSAQASLAFLFASLVLWMSA